MYTVHSRVYTPMLHHWSHWSFIHLKQIVSTSLPAPQELLASVCNEWLLSSKNHAIICSTTGHYSTDGILYYHDLNLVFYLMTGIEQHTIVDVHQIQRQDAILGNRYCGRVERLRLQDTRLGWSLPQLHPRHRHKSLVERFNLSSRPPPSMPG